MQRPWGRSECYHLGDKQAGRGGRGARGVDSGGRQMPLNAAGWAQARSLLLLYADWEAVGSRIRGNLTYAVKTHFGCCAEMGREGQAWEALLSHLL